MWEFAPSEFWRMTPREWWLIFDAKMARNKAEVQAINPKPQFSAEEEDWMKEQFKKANKDG